MPAVAMDNCLSLLIMIEDVMPIYAYKCAACGFKDEHLQKISAAPLTVCPCCAAPRYEKQVTAAGFQLKGSGWYVTDFRQSGGATAAAPKAEGSEASATAPEQSGSNSDASSAPASSTAAAPASGDSAISNTNSST